MEILTQINVNEKLETGMLKRLITRIKLLLFPDIDIAKMKEGFFRAFHH